MIPSRFIQELQIVPSVYIFIHIPTNTMEQTMVLMQQVG
jgi:hypothetical protein